MLEAAICATSSLSVVVAGRGGGSAVGGRSSVLRVITSELGRVLAGESDELVAVAALWDLDAVLVSPVLDLAVAPTVEELVAERLLGTGSGGRGR